MPITERQRQRRMNHIGASDMAAIMGLDKFHTPYDIWLEKTGKLEIVEQPDDPNDPMNLGQALEPVVLSYAERVLGPLKRNQFRKHPTLPIGSNLDALLLSAPRPIEAKTGGLRGPVSEPWGDEGTDHIPDRVLIQVHTQGLAMAPVEVDTAYVAAYLGGHGFATYVIHINADITNAIAEAADRFWRQHVQADVPPEGAPSLAVARLIKRTPGKTVSVPAELFATLLDMKAAFREAQSYAEVAQAELLAAMGDADGAVAIDRDDAFTYFEQTRAAYAVPEQTYRVLRYRKKGLPEQ